MAVEIKGSWTIYNLRGIPKKFKTSDSPEAVAWMSDRSDPAEEKRIVAEAREQARAEKAAAQAAIKLAKKLAKQAE